METMYGKVVNVTYAVKLGMNTTVGMVALVVSAAKFEIVTTLLMVVRVRFAGQRYMILMASVDALDVTTNSMSIP